MKLLLSPVEKISSPSLRASFENSMEIARHLADRLNRDAIRATKHLGNRFSQASRASDSVSDGKYLEKIARDEGVDFLCLYERAGQIWHLTSSFPYQFDRIDSTIEIEVNEFPAVLDLSDRDLVASCLPLSRDTLLVAGLALEPGLTARMRKTGKDLSLYSSAGEWVTTMRLYIMILLSMIVVAAAVSATLLSRALARRISFPIKELANATQHLASGDLNYRVRVQARDEIGLLIESFNKMAQELKANRDHIIAMTRRQAQMDRDFDIAREVQSNLFPKILPHKQSWQFAATCLPAKAVGGDYYDIFEVEPGKVLIAHGDVSGKGLGASLVMASIHAVIRSLAATSSKSPAMIANEINRYLIEASGDETFVTLFVGLIDCNQGMLTYINCGHPPAILQRKHGKIERLAAEGTVLGVLPDYDVPESTCSLDRGDGLLIVSDGITEALNLEDEMFEDERLLDTIREKGQASAQEMIEAILKAVERFTAGREQADDISIIAIRHKM